jgi:hypothetical protein
VVRLRDWWQVGGARNLVKQEHGELDSFIADAIASSRYSYALGFPVFGIGFATDTTTLVGTRRSGIRVAV